ncbi:MAG: HigA family addiction module antitoxin [Candidatus Marinimicrobia bacterium]|nr:HigA family addiction module antitoxin [Candidatus Neomarinimicrobiota bacterium]
MTTNNTFNPDYAIHPGKILNEKLEEINMTSKEFAIRTGKPIKTISEVINCRSSITPEMSVQFEKVLKIPANFWLNSQANYNEIIAKIKRHKDIQEAESWTRNFPYRKMAEFGWVKKTRKINEKTEELFNFFNISKASSWKKIYLNGELPIYFRISLKSKKNPYSLSAWLAKGDEIAKNINIVKYNKTKLKSILPDLKKTMLANSKDLFSKIQSICSNAGVKIIFTPLLPQTGINGAVRWIGENPIIQISDRYKRYDIFWFSLFHEIGHIILHGNKKNIFLENAKNIDTNNIKEKEANEFAKKHLLNDKQYNEFTKQIKNKTKILEKIDYFANKFNTHRDILIGRLLYEKKNSYYFLRKQINKINFKNFTNYETN